MPGNQVRAAMQQAVANFKKHNPGVQITGVLVAVNLGDELMHQVGGLGPTGLAGLLGSSA
jgi:hypothetical protein